MGCLFKRERSLFYKARPGIMINFYVWIGLSYLNRLIITASVNQNNLVKYNEGIKASPQSSSSILSNNQNADLYCHGAWEPKVEKSKILVASR